MLTQNDLDQIRGKGIEISQIDRQLAYFKTGFPFLPIAGAAVAGDGILRFDPDEIRSMVRYYDRIADSLTVVKFVPASGAATRMFKDLYSYINEDELTPAVEEVLSRLDRFAFYEELTSKVQTDDPKKIAEAIVEPVGLGYGHLPKGLILFHAYENGARTAVEEHLAEGAKYAVSSDGTVKIHFTVSPEHQSGFAELIGNVLPEYESRYGVRYDISYSRQKSKTDTLAVDKGNEPFRDEEGKLLFRPAGHGALLENLNEIDADLIFIKNIDNVVPDRIKGDTVTYKKVIAAVLVDIRDKIYGYLRRLDSPAGEIPTEEIQAFIKTRLGYKFSPEYSVLPAEKKAELLRGILNRPVRVCGMVKNEGEPGGGPFWVNNDDGSQSLQIAESSQIAPEQKELMRTATHFNPVDLVCSVRDYKGGKFDLTKFVDPDTGFISVKSRNGKELKAQELPGLWNGSMARWNTLFVEVPVSTFNPVKTVNDLLRPQHQ